MRLGQFFEDDVGAFSLMRLMAFLAFAVVLGVWVWGNLAAGHYVPLGYSEAGIITAAIAGKAAQARFEYGGPYYHGLGGSSLGVADSGGSRFERQGALPEFGSGNMNMPQERERDAEASGGRMGPGDSGPTPSPRQLGEE